MNCFFGERTAYFINAAVEPTKSEICNMTCLHSGCAMTLLDRLLSAAKSFQMKTLHVLGKHRSIATYFVPDAVDVITQIAIRPKMIFSSLENFTI